MPSTSTNLLSTAGFTFSWDLLIIIAAIIGVVLYGFTSGKNKIFTFLLSTYFSFLIVEFLPWKDLGAYLNYKKDFPSATFEIFVFLALIVAFCFLFPNSALGSSLRLGRTGRSSWYQVIIFSILQVGVLASAVLSFLPAKNLPDLNSLVKQLFIGQTPLFIWILLPILGIILLRKGRAEI